MKPFGRCRVAAAVAVLATVACGEEPMSALGDPARFESARFVLYDFSQAPQSLIDSMLTRLELDYERVAAFLPDFEAPSRVAAHILPGNGIPYVEPFEATLNQFRNDISFDYFVHQLTHLWTGYTRRPFLEEGIAVYATERLLPGVEASPFYRQPPHAWVSLFQQNDALIALPVTWSASNFDWSYSGSTADASVWQVFVEAGSFTRWVFDAFGRETWRALYDTEDLEPTLGQSPEALQAEWLSAAVAVYPSPLPCEDALAPLTSRREFWCLLANGSTTP